MKHLRVLWATCLWMSTFLRQRDVHFLSFFKPLAPKVCSALRSLQWAGWSSMQVRLLHCSLGQNWTFSTWLHLVSRWFLGMTMRRPVSTMGAESAQKACPTLLVKKMTLPSKRTNFGSRSPIFQSRLWPGGLTNFWFLDCKWKIFS